MKFKNNLLASGSTILTALLFVANSSISYADTDDDEYVTSTRGLQLSINTGAVDGVDMTGIIKININHVQPEPSNGSPSIGQLGLPSINFGAFVEYDPYDPYYYGDSIRDLLEEQIKNPPFPYENDIFTHLGDAQIYPPMALNYERSLAGETVFIEMPGVGIVGFDFLPEGSVKKIGKNKYSINFDSCDLMYLAGPQCGEVALTVTANGNHVSKFKGERKDKFKYGSGENARTVNYKFKGKFVEKTADVEGSIFGREMHINLKAVISTHRVSNSIEQ